MNFDASFGDADWMVTWTGFYHVSSCCIDPHFVSRDITLVVWPLQLIETVINLIIAKLSFCLEIHAHCLLFIIWIRP